MSSIPLPALHVNPPQPPENPLEGYGKILQLKNMMQQGQLQQQAVEEGKIHLQDQQAGLKAMQQWDGKDFDAFPGLLQKNGASFETVSKARMSVLEQKQKFSAIAKDDAETGKNNLETLKGKNDLVVGALNTLDKVPDEQLAQNLTETAQTLTQQGLVDPQHAQMALQVAQQGDPQKIRQGLEVFKKSLLGSSTQMEQAQKEAQTRLANAEATQKENLNLVGGDEQFRKAKYQFILNRIKQGLPVADEEKKYAQSYEASEAKSTTQSDTLGVTSTSTSKPAGLAAVSGRTGGAGATQPSAKDSIVDMVGQYKLNPMMLQRMIIKHPEVIAAVGQKYPDFDQTNYQAKAKAMESFTSGPYSRQINATNVALDHLGVLADAVEGLKNGDVKVLNRIANSFGLQTGSSAVTVFNTIAHKLAPELAQAYIQGGGGEGERQNIQKDYDASLGPEQLQNNLAITARLLQPNVETIQQQYKNTIGRDDFQQRFLTPGAQKTLSRFSPQNGQQHAPGARANLPEGKTGTGSDGKKYIVKGGVWVPQP